MTLNTNHDQRPGESRRRSGPGTVPWRLLAGAALGSLLLSGCQSNQSLTLGDMASSYNREILGMSLWAIALSVIIFIGVSAALFYTVNKFREENNTEAPAQFHGNNRLEVILVVVPVIIVMFLSVLTVRSMARLNPTSKESVAIETLGRQFWWNFAYPASAVQGGGVVTNGNEMIMPTRQKVAITLTSGDVIHGFWAPNIGGQRAAIPTVKKVWEVDTDREGVYQGNCSQLCGASHANMRYKVVALDQDRFNTVMTAAKAYVAPTPMAGSPEAAGYALFMQGKSSTGAVACAACHRVQGTPAAGVSGPDLSFFGTRRTLGAGMWEAMTAQHWEEPKAAAELHAWLKHSPVVKPGSLMPRYDGGSSVIAGKVTKGGTLTDEEIDDIAAYLRSLRLPEEADYWRGTPVNGGQGVGQ